MHINTKTISIIFFLLTYYIFVRSIITAKRIAHYQPATVILTGIIKAKKFPTPPKNENIGDKEEIYRYLELDYPLDVIPQKTDSDIKNETLRNVTTIQIVRIEDDTNSKKTAYSNWSDSFIGKHVRVTGKLYSRVVRVIILAEHFEKII